MKTRTSAGFQLLSIDHWMRSPGAEFVGAIIAACSIVVSLVVNSEDGMSLSRALYLLRTRTGVLALFGLLFAIGGWWTVRTWRRLWRSGRSPWERVVYDYGVRLFGFSLSIALIIIFAYFGRESESDQRLLMINGAIAALFFGTPVALNLGYFWGEAYAAAVGAEKDPAVEKGEPPLLK
jgi:multisubunit Na+/H+ antiporter MnhB subunit